MESSSPLNDVSLAFGQALAARRAVAGVSQEELAYQAGVDRTFVSRLERGIRQPTISTLIALGAALGVSAATLVEDVEKALKRTSKARK